MNSSQVYLVQTDTTVGFLSDNQQKLSQLKRRPSSKKMIQVVDSLSTLKQCVRVPKIFRRRVRKAKKTTFIYPNGTSYRVISNDSPHIDFIKKFRCLYSTSANITQQDFSFDYASSRCDSMVEDYQGFNQTTASKIYQLSRKRCFRLR